MKFVFTSINKYPVTVFEKTLREVKEKCVDNILVDDIIIPLEPGNNVDVVTPHIGLPYKGKEGHNLVQKFKKYLTGILPPRVIPRFTYKGKKLGSFFKIKDKISWEHESDLVYHYGCNFSDESDCSSESNYVGETNVRVGTRVYEHGNTDRASAIYKHSRNASHEVDNSNFKIVGRGYSRCRDRKIAEALFIRDLEPNLNAQVKSHNLQLFV